MAQLFGEQVGNIWEILKCICHLTKQFQLKEFDYENTHKNHARICSSMFIPEFYVRMKKKSYIKDNLNAPQ